VAPVDPTARELAQLAEQLLAHEEREPVVHDIVARAVTMLPGTHHAGLTVRARRGSGHESLAATDDVASACDGLLDSVRQGPGLAVEAGEPVCRCGDPAHDPRWPNWGRQAAKLGVGSSLSVRLVGRGDYQGSLNLYSRDLFAFGDRDSVDLAVLFAGHAAAALAVVTEIAGLRTALESRHVIGAAQGILVERYGVTVDGAFEVLKRQSSVHNLKLRDIAVRLVETGDMPLDARPSPLAVTEGARQDSA
jgi:ANTAR domain-containing protein/GAF domain-containing protein